jgi:hypothetical protein
MWFGSNQGFPAKTQPDAMKCMMGVGFILGFCFMDLFQKKWVILSVFSVGGVWLPDQGN